MRASKDTHNQNPTPTSRIASSFKQCIQMTWLKKQGAGILGLQSSPMFYNNPRFCFCFKPI
jgi:hypothetical protein